MQALLDLPQTWTFEDLQRSLPADADWRRYEIVDGALIGSPSAGFDHEVVSALLRSKLQATVPDGYVAIGPITVDLRPTYRIPDLVVAPLALFGRNRTLVAALDALLVVEIVSPSTRTTDRITKPAQYAAAGIGAYWLVETDPEITLTAYTLAAGADVYTEIGTWGSGETAALDSPFPVAIAIDDLTPRG